MKRAITCALVLVACGGQSTTSPFLVSTAAVVADNPFVVNVVWEPSAGEVTVYTLEARSAGAAQFADLGRLFQAPHLEQYIQSVDLTPAIPNGGPVELRVRADPGGFESNVFRYDPGPSLSAVSVTVPQRDGSSGFVVTYGNHLQATVVLERRVLQLDGSATPFVQVATGIGPSNTFADRDLTAWKDGAIYEYRATASVPGAVPSASAFSSVAPLNAPELVSYSGSPGTGSSLVLLNHSAVPVSFSLAAGIPGRLQNVSFGNAAAGGQGTVHDPDGTIGPHFFEITVETAADRPLRVASATVSFWQFLEPAGFIFRPSVLSSSVVPSFAARDDAGNFCFVVNRFSPAGVLVGSTVIPPGKDAAAALSVDSSPSGRCRIDAAGVAHVVFAAPDASGALDVVTHAFFSGGVWQKEVIATATNPGSNAEVASDHGIAFDIGVDGTLYAAWFDTASIGVAQKPPSGTWAVDQAPRPSFAGVLAINGDETGAPHLITVDISGFTFHLSRGAGGWVVDSVPFSQSFGGGQVEMSVVSGIVTFVFNLVGGSFERFVVRGNASGWQFTDLGVTQFMAAAHSPDGTAFVVTDGLDVSIFRFGGVLEAQVQRPQGTGVSAAVGFRSDGKAWLLQTAKPFAFFTGDAPLPPTTFVYDEL